MILALTPDAQYTCGAFGASELYFNGIFPNIVSLIISLIQFGIPVILIILGMMDLGKAVMAQKEDEIKKGQGTFVKRLIAAAIVFFVIFIVKMVIGLVAPTNSTNIINCIDCFTNAKVDGTKSCIPK